MKKKKMRRGQIGHSKKKIQIERRWKKREERIREGTVRKYKSK